MNAALLIAALAATETPKVGPELQAPRLIHYAEPQYPEIARQGSVSGKVRLKLSVNPAGEVDRVELVADPGHGIGEAAMFAATHFVFAPAIYGDERVGVQIDYVIDFQLRDTAEPEPNPAVLPETDRYETVVTTRRLRREIRRPPVEIDITPTLSRYRLNRRSIEMTPGSLEDISRALQSMPGVVAEPGLLATLFVRGGEVDDTLFYLDGVPLSNPFHLGGFASIFNPELVNTVDFYAGGQPARYRDSMGGVVDIGYVRGDPETLDLIIDVSMHTAKAVVSGPAGIDGLSFLVSARRSYFEAYFAALQAIGIVGNGISAPDLGEYLGKMSYQRGKHRLDVTFLYATDGLNFESTQGDDSLIGFDGSLRISNQLVLSSLRWEHHASDQLSIASVFAYVRDDNSSSRFGSRGESGTGAGGALVSSGDSVQDHVIGRLDIDAELFWGNLLRLGADVSWRRQRFVGRVSDTRTFPTWVNSPVADYHLGTLPSDREAPDISQSQDNTELGLYAEDEWTNLLPGLTPRAGIRLSAEPGSPVLLSPRLGIAYSPREGTVLKVATGLYYQRPRDPLQRDPTYGNPQLEPERVWQFIGGVEQFLPWRILVRAEGYYNDLDNLIVNPDNRAAIANGVPFTNAGFGYAAGFDLLIARRGPVWGAGISYGLLYTKRTNPLNDLHLQRYAPLQHQAHTLAASADLHLGDSWVFALRYQFHSGRPHTRITAWALDEREGVWLPTLGKLRDDGRRGINGARFDPFHELSVRAEWWLRFVSWRMTIYAEIINITNYRTTIVETYDDGVVVYVDPMAGDRVVDHDASTEPKRGSFDTLPIRPFLGLRGEF